MVYVPVHVPTTTAPSRRARELSRQVVELVRILREEDEKISAMDVQTGLQLAQQELRKELGGSQKALVLTVLAASAVVGALVFSTVLTRREVSWGYIALFVGVFVAVHGVLIAVLAKKLP